MGIRVFTFDRRSFALFLIAATLILHSNSLGVPFFWDDDAIIGNPVYQANPFSVWTTPIIRPDSGYYRPIPFSLLGIVGTVAGFDNPVPFHLMTLVFVCLAGFLFFNLASRFFSLEISFLISLLFVGFPTHVEAFAWISAFPDVLSLVGSLLFLTFFLDDCKKTYPTARMGAALLLGLLSKESAFILLPFALLMDWPAIRNRHFKRILQFHVPLWILFSGYYLLHGAVAPGVPGLTYSAPLVLKTFAAYALKLIYPWPLLVSIGNRTSAFDWQAALGIGLALAAVYGIFFARSQVIRLATALACCAFIPYSNFWLFRGDYLIAERYMLLIVAGACLLAGAVLTKMTQQLRYAVVLGLVVVYFGSSWLQYGTWQNERQLWVDTARAEPEKYTPYSKLAEFDARNGDYESAAKNFEIAFRNLQVRKAAGLMTVTDGVVSNLFSLGQRIYYNLGQFDKAIFFARLKYKAEPSAPLVIGAIQIHDHRLDYPSAVSAAVKGAEFYPGDGPLISEGLRFAALGGNTTAVNVILAKSTYPGAASVATYYTRMYASMTTLPAFTRGGMLADAHVYSLAFREFESVANQLSANQAFLVGQFAFQEHLWFTSHHFLALASGKEDKAEFRMWLGMALQRLERKDEACLAFKEALLTANAEEHAKIMELASSCDLFRPDQN